MKRDYPDRPFVAVGVLIWRDDQILLIRRAKEPKKDAWSIPGGAQDLGETVYETAHREVLEETGLTIRNLELLDVIDLIDRDADNQVRHHYTLVDLQADYHDGDIIAGDDCAEARWVYVQDLSQYDLWEETITLISRSATKRSCFTPNNNGH